MKNHENITKRPLLLAICCTATGIAVGAIGSQGLAQGTPPSEHKGLSLVPHGAVSEQTLAASVGLDGHIMQLRAITIAPGGQIAKHSHATRPGIVKVIDGEWVEGRDGGEITYTPERVDALIEDEKTVHWFFNRGDTPATALVCDIVPAT